MNNRVINVYQKNVKGFLIEPLKFRLFPVTEGNRVSPSETPGCLSAPKPRPFRWRWRSALEHWCSRSSPASLYLLRGQPRFLRQPVRPGPALDSQDPTKHRARGKHEQHQDPGKALNICKCWGRLGGAVLSVCLRLRA